MAPFCSSPASLVSRKFFAVGPGCARCLFFVVLRWAPRPFGGARAKKKKHHPGCFFAPAPGKGRGRRSPVPARGQSKKKNTTQGVFFFCCGPGERQGKEKPPWVVFFCFCSGPVPAPNGASPSPAFPRGRSKKKTPRVVFFFALAPCRRPTGLLLPLPFAGAAAKKKNTLGGVFFFALAPCRHGASPSPAFPRGRSKKKNTLGGVFFLLRPRADAHSLTAGLGGDASPSPGWCFCFCCSPARTGLVFLFWLWPRPDAHSLTVGWGDFGKARVVFFFLLRPRRVFLDNNKKCLGYYIGSKKTRRGHSKKKTPLP